MKNANFQREGYQSGLTGYVTQLEHLVGKNARDLAVSLGYSSSALSEGYGLYFLIQSVGPADFRWKDRSRYSAGWAVELIEYEWKGRIVKEYVYVDRYDQLRSAKDIKNFKKRINGQANLPDDWAMDEFTSIQQVTLNVRTGPRRIAKVIPKKRLGSGDYPDAPGNGVPQWEIVTTKQFVCAAIVSHDQVIRAGVFDMSYCGAGR